MSRNRAGHVSRRQRARSQSRNHAGREYRFGCARNLCGSTVSPIGSGTNSCRLQEISAPPAGEDRTFGRPPFFFSSFSLVARTLTTRTALAPRSSRWSRSCTRNRAPLIPRPRCSKETGRNIRSGGRASRERFRQHHLHGRRRRPGRLFRSREDDQSRLRLCRDRRDREMALGSGDEGWSAGRATGARPDAFQRHLDWPNARSTIVGDCAG